ncbi:trypsin-like peptidase domain-containing protein [Rhizobium leguminosarum]|uniref:trypsin-like serine peptidase n=1 Tax=Rhizobium leguminosarum TaxID=384 RepID=UPI001C93E263|nr:serine protease [Rhizobium leguminosarum]MBY5783879.1 trypsin-like peptidase domain-containing protein [Rhizobium leguminosarum]
MNMDLSIRDLIKNMEWKHNDKEELIDFWRTKAIRAALPQRGIAFFRSLVDSAELNDDFRAEMANPFVGDANVDARTLFVWAQGKGVNPENPKYTTLGSIMLPTISSLGVDDARFTAAFIVKYKLIVDPEERRRFAARFQVPVIGEAPAASDIAVGPDFSWSGSNDELQLQKLFRPDPLDWDIGFLIRAITAASGVCRIEINGAPGGTGFLIAPNLVVTNYHVLGKTDAEIDATAPNVKLRFGALTNEAAQEDVGQLAALDAASPVLSKSPVEKHDFVVLRTDTSKCKGTKPVTLQKTAPAQDSNLSVIHHSGGQAMRLQFSPTGVSTIMQQQGKLQYASRTTGGSSGSPCFNDDFAVIAIHHAARSTLWGVAGEGILISALYEDEQVKQYLDGGQ